MQMPTPALTFRILVAYYTLYPIVCAMLIVSLQIVLHRAGALFLHESFSDNPAMAQSIRRLLDIGYYQVCAGYFIMTVHTNVGLVAVGLMVEIVSVKVGFFVLLLGVLHVFNLLLLALFRGRRPATQGAS